MNYTIVPITPSVENIELYAGLLSTVFKNKIKFNPEFIKWLYADNPQGQVIGADAFFEGKLVAHFATIPFRYCINKIPQTILLTLHTVTLPQHQGKGLFTRLGEFTYNFAKEKGFGYAFAISNQNSTPGFIKNLKFKLIAPLDVKIGVGRIEMEDAGKHSIYSVWSEEALNWRLKNPIAQYYTQNNAILAKTDVLGIMAQLAWQKECLQMTRLKFKKSIFKLWIGLSKNKKMKGFFINLPDFLKPSPLNLIMRDLNSDTLPIFTKEDFQIELIDFDAY